MGGFFWCFFFSSRRRHTRLVSDWSSDVCSSDLYGAKGLGEHVLVGTAPAILNAIRHETGAVIRNLPASPDPILAASKLK